MGGRGASSGVKGKALTPEQILASNIKKTQEISRQGLMPEGALEYGGTPEQRLAFYEAVDQAYKRLPEGYGYSIAERSGSYGHREHFIQLMKTYNRYDPRTGKMTGKKASAMIMGANGRVYMPSDLTSRASIRGYAKAWVYRAAGKIYVPKTGGNDREYLPFDDYGYEIKEET